MLSTWNLISPVLPVLVEEAHWSRGCGRAYLTVG